MKMFALFGAALLAATAAGPAAAVTLYSNAGGSLANLSGTGATIVSDGASQSWIGYLNLSQFVDLSVSTAGYTNLRINFSLRTLDSLDGNVGPGIDGINVTGNGATLLNDTFHYNGVNQSYAGAADAINDVNGFDFFGADRRYDLSFALGNAATTNVRFLAFTDQTDEGFGIDNIVLTGDLATGVVPEPATWAMMIGGMGLAGGTVRRRKAALRFA